MTLTRQVVVTDLEAGRFRPESGQRVYVNPRMVIAVTTDDEFGNAILVTPGDPIYVREGVEEVLRLLGEAGVDL